jgi:hypothetical protein
MDLFACRQSGYYQPVPCLAFPLHLIIMTFGERNRNPGHHFAGI